MDDPAGEVSRKEVSRRCEGQDVGLAVRLEEAGPEGFDDPFGTVHALKPVVDDRGRLVDEPQRQAGRVKHRAGADLIRDA